MATHNTTISQGNCTDKSKCNTQLFYDRDVELLRCNEEKNCSHKQYYNNMTICTCPRNKG